MVTIADTPRAPFGARLFDWFERLSYAMYVARGMEHRQHQIERLNAKTDEELAAMNLRREDIVHHVFRDILYV